MKKVLRYELETDVEKRVVRDASRHLGLTSIKLTLKYDAGWPDRLFFIPGGRPFLIEFKRSGEEPEPLQADKIEQLTKLGYDVEWHDNYDAAMTALRKRMK
jgi:hypothetical protein